MNPRPLAPHASALARLRHIPTDQESLNLENSGETVKLKLPVEPCPLSDGCCANSPEAGLHTFKGQIPDVDQLRCLQDRLK